MTSVTVKPIMGALDAEVALPGSKSIANRALVIAALAEGQSTLLNVADSDDVMAMAECLRALGADIVVSNSSAEVSGMAGRPDVPAAALDARQSGTTARFVLPLLALAGGGVISGHSQMLARPMGDQVIALRSLGAEVASESLPIRVHGSIDGRTVSMSASTSSQFVSGLMMVGPCLPNGLEIHLDGPAVSTPYIEMTAAVMRSFGAAVEWTKSAIVIAPGGYNGRDFVIEPDASTATYPLAAAAIVGGRVRVPGLGFSSIQGDMGFIDVIESMGAEVHVDADSVEVRGSRELHGIEVDLGDMSDTAPTFGALAAKALGSSRVTGIGFIRETKESDRVGGVVRELNRAGVTASVDDDGFTVIGGPHVPAEIETYEDHRMAMSMALLGLTRSDITITGAECVAKTFPRFFEMLDALRETASTEPRVLAIDGPAGSGKSTIAKLMATELRMPHLDTGSMYRAITWAVLDAGVALDDHEQVTALAGEAELWIGRKAVVVNGHNVTSDIRTAPVTGAVSAVASNPRVREVLVSQQRKWAARRGAAVVEGRDIGSVVFPDATLKVFLTASVAERARRRAAETGETDLAAMEAAIERRDLIDSTREHDPLVVADDAVVIDSSELTTSEVVQAVQQRWKALR